MTNRIRVGLVGLGDAATHHARGLLGLEAQDVLCFSAVCGRDLERVERACARLNVPSAVRRFTSLAELLAARACDALILATPDGLHVSQILRCAELGVHVLAEKPLALTRADGERAAAAAAASGIVLQVGYHLRHHTGHRLVRAQLATLIGQLRGISVRWAWPDPATDGWRASGQDARFFSLAALGTHAIDLALWFAGSAVDGVAALTVPAQGIDRAAEVSLRFQCGVLAQLSVAVTYRACSRLLLVGERGELECLGTLGSRGEGELWLRQLRQPPQLLPFTPQDPYRMQLQTFLERILSKTPALDDVNSAIANLSILDQIPGP